MAETRAGWIADLVSWYLKTKMCVADPKERKRWLKIGVRKLIRESGLSPTTVYKILEGEPVRCYILASFTQVANNITR